MLLLHGLDRSTFLAPLFQHDSLSLNVTIGISGSIRFPGTTSEPWLTALQWFNSRFVVQSPNLAHCRYLFPFPAMVLLSVSGSLIEYGTAPTLWIVCLLWRFPISDSLGLSGTTLRRWVAPSRWFNSGTMALKHCDGGVLPSQAVLVTAAVPGNGRGRGWRSGTGRAPADRDASRTTPDAGVQRRA